MALGLARPGDGHEPVAWFFSDRLVLRMSGAREVSREEAPDLHRMVEELSTKAGLPKPRVLLIDAPHANAFATGRNPQKAAVAVTRGLLEILDPREVRGVLAHEIARLNGIVAFASEWETLGLHPQGGPNPLLECHGWNCQCELKPVDRRRSPRAFETIMNIIGT